MKYTRESLTELIHSEISKHLEKEHFIRIERDGDVFYKRHFDWGWDYCSLNRVLFLETHIEFGINISRRYNFIEEIWQEFASLLNINYVDSNYDLMNTIIVNHGNSAEEIKQKAYFDGSLRFEISEQGLTEVPEAIEFVMEKIFKKLNELKNIKKLDELENNMLEPPVAENPIFWVDGGFMFKRMILAKLNGNKLYEDICNLYKNRLMKATELAKTPGKEYFLNYPIVFEKIYERLKNVGPLKNLILSDKTA